MLPAYIAQLPTVPMLAPALTVRLQPSVVVDGISVTVLEVRTGDEMSRALEVSQPADWSDERAPADA
jgi:hypothetical protein